jgi:hypothetical protein
MKRAIVAMLVTALAFVAAGCEVPEASGDTAKGNKKNNSKPVKVQASKILKEFEENEAAADAKYKNKTLEVSGFVDKIDTEFIDDEEYVVNVSDGSEYAIFTVNCDDQKSKDVTPLKKGQKITVVGNFEDGGDLGVELDNCSIK